MAIVKIHNIKTTLEKAVAYIENPEKTEDELLVSGYNCDIHAAAIEFEITKLIAEQVKGSSSKKDNENLAHHVVQSFAPYDKVTPAQAHEIGRKFADEFLQGKYEYVIATHVDKGHIHNHIIFNSVSFYDFKKFRNYKVAGRARAISDRLCVENGLYVPAFRRRRSRGYYEWEQRQNKTSWIGQLEDILQDTIDHTESFEEFCDMLLDHGVEIGNVDPAQGKHIKFRMSGQQRFCRGYNLQGDDGQDFSRESIFKRFRERDSKEVSYAEHICDDAA